VGRRSIHRAGIAAVLCLGALSACSSTGTAHGKAVASPAVARAVAGTVHSGSAQFSLTVGLSKPLAAFLGDSTVSTVSGKGEVDFTRRRASWSVELPPSLGSSVQAIADGGTTYVSYPPLSPPGAPRWIELSSNADYADFDTVPWIRDLVVLTNPLRVLDAVDSTPGSIHTTSMPVMPRSVAAVTLAAWERSGVQPELCVPTKSSSGPMSVKAADVFAVGATAEEDVIRAWKQNQISTEIGQSGVCEATVSVENPDGLGFDVKVTIDKQGVPVTVGGIKGELKTQFSTAYHVSCLVGDWAGTTTANFPAAGDLSEMVGGGSVLLHIADPKKVLENARMSTQETFNGTEQGHNYGAGIAHGSQDVTYHRRIDAIGRVLATSTGLGNIALAVHGDVSLTESGAIVGSRAATFTGRSLILTGTFTCVSMDLHSGHTTYHFYRAAPGVSVGAVSVSENWRPLAAQDAGTPAPGPSPTTQSSPTTQTTTSPPSVGLGAAQSSWTADHVADPQVANAYDPKPGSYPGSYFQDEFLGVTFLDGELESYEQQLAPSTTQAQASAAVRAYLPPDATIVIPATNLGTCAEEILQSPSIAASQGSGSGGISVVYASDYTSSSKNYDPSDVRTAFVTMRPGGLPQSASDLSPMACG
jgi:hypothetical protein